VHAAHRTRGGLAIKAVIASAHANTNESVSVCDVHVCTCARAHTHIDTHRHKHTQMPHRRSLSPTRPLSLCCCQIKAWKAGHKGECKPAARADTRTAAKLTADQIRMLEILKQLDGAADWRGVAAQERAARAVAAALRTSMPSIGGTSSDLTSLAASFIYCTLGNAYQNLGDFNKAIEYHTQHLAIAKEVGDREGEERAYGNLGNAYQSQGGYAKAIKYHTQCLSIAKEVGDRAGEGRAYGSLGNAYQSQGGCAKAIEYHTKHLAIAKEVGDRAGEGNAYGNLGSAYQNLGSFSKALEHHKEHLTIAKEVGNRAGEGAAYGNLGCAYSSQGDFSKAIIMASTTGSTAQCGFF